MRKVVTIIVIVLFFLVLLALIVVKLLPSHSNTNQTRQETQDPFAKTALQSSQIQTDSPLNTVRTCYAWYVQASGHGANALTAQERGETTKCFTSNFISKWSTLIESTGGDPVLLAQFVGKSWNMISVTAVSQSIDSSDQMITLGTGNEQAKLIAHVVKDRSGDDWRIDAVSAPN